MSTNSVPIRFRPLERWPAKPTTRRCRPFKAPYRDTLDKLYAELRHLGAKNVIIEGFFRSNQIRNDGWPYSSASPSEPGIVLSFDSRHGPLRLYTDDCDRWEHNLRAIAMHLHDLRHSSLYGVGKDGQQYRGWKRLPGGGEAIVTPAPLSVEEAAAFVATASGVTTSTVMDRNCLNQCLNLAALKFHPDTNAGRELPEWHKLQEAKEVLRRFHGL